MRIYSKSPDENFDLFCKASQISERTKMEKPILLNAKIKLETKLVGNIDGVFHIPSFQRGYRWGHDEVTRLLDDIYINKTKNYCLQPVVIIRREGVFDLIDGQQRLTTLFLIYKYMQLSFPGFFDEPKFSLSYETRDKSKQFLSSLDLTIKDENIDFWFMSEAYETIKGWFEDNGVKSTVTNFNKYFDENVKVIWYEVDESIDAIALFTRLNIGKIQLTNAELVKAMFLSKDNNPGMNRTKQEEISLQWDNIEKELHNDSLWYFLTNTSSSKYQTRIDLILDLISNKTRDTKDKYFTFFHFDALKKVKRTDEIWREIQHTFLMLKDWFEDHELYHKIGYLITSEEKTLQEIFSLAFSKKDSGEIGITKRAFKSKLDEYIKESVHIEENYSELSYERSADYIKISKLLLLFNVESIRSNSEQTQWFPFEKFKVQNTGSVIWSLEHIHAQQSDGMKKQEDWKEWLRLHIPSITALQEDNRDLIANMNEAYEMQPLDRKSFEVLQKNVIEKLSTQGNTKYLHSISNLCLLNTNDNAALSNSTFDVKRNAIIEMDKRGQYIPFCTKMVFLKYYTPSEGNQLHFWGQQDRVAYVKAINHVLGGYLADEVLIEVERG